MRILSIETSCDETAVALLEITGPIEKPQVKVLGNNLYSQVKLHEQYGGVHPSMAKREHIKNLPILLEQTLKQAGENEECPNIDFVAVTRGPGLEPALWQGILFAEELGRKWDKPVVPVDHMEGHIWSVLPGLQEGEFLHLPALALLISGGHTELVYMKELGHFEILGQTKDDAAGEAYDKIARLLGLSYPGGPKISRLAEINRAKLSEAPIAFPRPMMNSGDLNFSFSGLKTAVLYKLKADQWTDLPAQAGDEYKEGVARSFDDAVMEVLTSKTRQALEQYNTKTLIIAGGVAASPRVRELFEKVVAEFPGLTLYTPGQGLATDNAIMIGVAAFMSVTLDPTLLTHTEKIKAEGNKSRRKSTLLNVREN